MRKPPVAFLLWAEKAAGERVPKTFPERASDMAAESPFGGASTIGRPRDRHAAKARAANDHGLAPAGHVLAEGALVEEPGPERTVRAANAGEDVPRVVRLLRRAHLRFTDVKESRKRGLFEGPCRSHGKWMADVRHRYSRTKERNRLR